LNDRSIEEARFILGENKIIGGTANTISDVLQRMNEPCDYIGLGPLRFTDTKEKLSPVLGFEGYQELLKILKKILGVPKIFAIGSVIPEDIFLYSRSEFMEYPFQGDNKTTLYY
jgi:thiamine-phosphate pyrophosphorylase